MNCVLVNYDFNLHDTQVFRETGVIFVDQSSSEINLSYDRNELCLESII